MNLAADHSLCRQSAKLFLLANERNADSVKFAERLFHSEIAPVFYNKDLPTNWLGETYVMSVLEDELHFEKGETFSDDVMYWAGYLYRVWSLLYDDTPEEIITQAPLSLLNRMFQGLHVMSYEMAIEDLKNLYHENQKYSTGSNFCQPHIQ